MTTRERILVIRLGALGDLVLCFQAFHEIRRAHPEAEIALLTMPAFAAFAQSMPWFDKVLIDERASGQDIGQWLRLIKQVRAFAPKRVYDLQGKFRQTVLYGCLGGPLGPEWSGAAPLCSHPRLWPPREGMHFTDFVAAHLRLAKFPSQAPPDLSWLDAPIDFLPSPVFAGEGGDPMRSIGEGEGGISPHPSQPLRSFDTLSNKWEREKFAMLIPGCAPGREYKRWPAKSYAALALRLKEYGIGAIAVGTKADANAIAAIRAEAPHVIDLSGQTSLPQLASLARRSAVVIGNDTGPTHLAAAAGAPTIALMSDRVNPVWSSPKGPKTEWLQGKPLESLGVDEVWKSVVSC